MKLADDRNRATYRRQRVVEREHVSGASCACGTWMTPLDRVYWKKQARGQVLTVGDVCPACRARTVTRNPSPTGGDYFAAAERHLYPTIPYMQMTAQERRHAHWLARSWWLASPLPGMLLDYDMDRALATHRALTAQLALDGYVTSPIPPCPLP